MYWNKASTFKEDQLRVENFLKQHKHYNTEITIALMN